jgi:uncharacterized coiled-coil DUF342 family protein
MFKRLAFGVLLSLVSSGLLFSFSPADKKEKAYELMYKDIQILKKKILDLDEQFQRSQERIDAVIKQLQELNQMVQSVRTEQAKIQNEQEKVPAQYQVLLEKFDSIGQQISNMAEDLIEIKQGTITPVTPGRNSRRRNRGNCSRGRRTTIRSSRDGGNRKSNSAA